MRQLGDQETDIISAVKPFTKYSVMITEPYSVKFHLDKAIYLATHGRFGPVWLDVPMNIQSAMIEEEKLTDFDENIDDCKNILEADKEQINKVIDKLSNAKKPIIIAGYGIRLSKQESNFYQLIDKLNIPVLSTFCGMDIMPSNHNLCAGRIGNVGQRAANIILQEADLILCLGTRNSIFSVSYNYENFGKNAYKIGVDIDNAELNKKTLKYDIAINSDLKDFIPELFNECNKLNTEE